MFEFGCNYRILLLKYSVTTFGSARLSDSALSQDFFPRDFSGLKPLRWSSPEILSGFAKSCKEADVVSWRQQLLSIPLSHPILLVRVILLFRFLSGPWGSSYGSCSRTARPHTKTCQTRRNNSFTFSAWTGSRDQFSARTGFTDL